MMSRSLKNHRITVWNPDLHDANIRMKNKEKILILDFGSQYTQLIARRVREAGVYSELHPFDMPENEIRAFAPAGIILSGGPDSACENETPKAPMAVFDLGVPVLGICYGMQLAIHPVDCPPCTRDRSIQRVASLRYA